MRFVMHIKQTDDYEGFIFLQNIAGSVLLLAESAAFFISSDTLISIGAAGESRELSIQLLQQLQAFL